MGLHHPDSAGYGALTQLEIQDIPQKGLGFREIKLGFYRDSFKGFGFRVWGIKLGFCGDSFKGLGLRV